MLDPTELDGFLEMMEKGIERAEPKAKLLFHPNDDQPIFMKFIRAKEIKHKWSTKSVSE
jgi:hypothetical protein